MSVSVPNILILGHSFVRRLKDDLAARFRFDARAAPNFHLPESGHVSLYGTGGRTVDKIHVYDLSLVLKYKPDIVILELGTNDLSTLRPEVVGSKIDDLAQVLRDQYKVRVIGVCQVVNRDIPHTRRYTDLDGVHCNAQGQFCLYRSYRGACCDYFIPYNFTCVPSRLYSWYFIYAIIGFPAYVLIYMYHMHVLCCMG